MDAPAPETEAPAPARRRAYPVVLFSIAGFPTQEPGRLMVWRIFWNGTELQAMRALKRLNKKLGKHATFSLQIMTAVEARNVRMKPFSLRDQRRRERVQAQADAAMSS